MTDQPDEPPPGPAPAALRVLVDGNTLSVLADDAAARLDALRQVLDLFPPYPPDERPAVDDLVALAEWVAHGSRAAVAEAIERNARLYSRTAARETGR